MAVTKVDAEGNTQTNVGGLWLILAGGEGSALLARMAASRAAKQTAETAETTQRTQLTAILAALDAGTATNPQIQTALARLIRRVVG